MIPLPLPHPIPDWRWITVTDEFRATKAYWPKIEKAAYEARQRSGWNPKTVQMGGHMVAIDYCLRPMGVLSAYKVALINDHEFLDKLPKNAPRAVRHIYRKEVRMKYLMMTSVWDFMRDISAAEKAAVEYNNALQKNSLGKTNDKHQEGSQMDQEISIGCFSGVKNCTVWKQKENDPLEKTFVVETK